MIRAFWQSKLAAGATLALTAAVIVIVWVRDADRPVYIPIVATVLLAAIGLLAGRLLGNIVASSQNVKALGLLHMELDPQAFLRAYSPVPARLKKGSVDHAVASAYLADGYAAAGDFSRAAETLCLPEENRKNKRLTALQGMYWQKLCSYRLFQGDVAQARKALSELDAVIAQGASVKEELVKNLKESRRLLQNRIAGQTNKQVEAGWLESQQKKAQYKLLRLEILQARAIAALRDGEREKAEECLNALIEDGGKTFYPQWAEEKKAAQ